MRNWVTPYLCTGRRKKLGKVCSSLWLQLKWRPARGEVAAAARPRACAVGPAGGARRRSGARRWGAQAQWLPRSFPRAGRRHRPAGRLDAGVSIRCRPAGFPGFNWGQIEGANFEPLKYSKLNEPIDLTDHIFHHNALDPFWDKLLEN